MLDKGRAEIAGKNGEFNFNCPLDQHIVNFLGFDPAALRDELAKGKGDGEILEWIKTHAKHQRTPWEIEQWSDYMGRRGPDSDAETLALFRGGGGKVLQDARRHQGLGRSARPR